MAAILQVIPASAEPYEVSIGNTATIGRLPDCELSLPSSDGISRRHALIRCYNGSDYQIIDLGSTNGTFVNETRVVLPVALKSGARIKIADQQIIFVTKENPDVEYNKTTIAQGAALSHSACPAALMVCDIRGFSSVAEAVPGNVLAPVLGEWFREASNIIQLSDGSIDKFIGDALFAYWKNPGDSSSECEIALKAARALLKLATTIRWPAIERPFEVAIALHFGEVSYGNVGVVAERDATIIGDAVNTVFRLEPVAKELNHLILVSQDFLTALPNTDGFKYLGERTLKGKRYPVRLFGVDDLKRQTD